MFCTMLVTFKRPSKWAITCPKSTIEVVIFSIVDFGQVLSH